MSDSASALRRGCELVAASLLRGVWGVKVAGLDLIPRSGRLIVACNHMSAMDPPVLASLLSSARRPRFMGKAELFRLPVLGWFLYNTGCIPLERGTADHSAMRLALETLEQDGAVGLFPEGTRMRPGERRPPKLGVSFLAAKTRAPVVPARVVGTREFPRAFPRTFPLELRFGAPLAPPAEGREAAAAFAQAVMDAIYAL